MKEHPELHVLELDADGGAGTRAVRHLSLGPLRRRPRGDEKRVRATEPAGQQDATTQNSDGNEEEGDALDEVQFPPRPENMRKKKGTN